MFTQLLEGDFRSMSPRQRQQEHWVNVDREKKKDLFSSFFKDLCIIFHALLDCLMRSVTGEAGRDVTKGPGRTLT